MIARLLLFFVLVSVSMSAQNEKITILFSSEMEGELNGFSPEKDYSPLTLNDDVTMGGYARVASIIKEERRNASHPVVAMDIGNSLLGSLFSSFEDRTGFQVALMRDMGYDVVGLGQKDFSYGPRFLSDAVNAAYDRSDIAPFVASNLAFNKDDYGDNELAMLFVNDVLKSYQVVENNGLRIGVLVIQSDLTELELEQIKPLGIADPLKTTQKLTDYLYKEENVDKVFVIAHSTLYKDKDGKWAGVPINIAEKIKGIHLILTMGPKLEMDSPLVVGGVPIIQAKSGGQYMGKVIVEKDNNEIKIVNFSQIPIDDKILGDAAIEKKIKIYESKIEAKLLSPFQLKYNTPIVESSYSLKCNSKLQTYCPGGSLLTADALHAQLNKSQYAKADVSIVATQGISENMEGGTFISSDLIRLINSSSRESSTPGAPVVELYVTNQELKSMMELLYQPPSVEKGPQFLNGGVKVKYNSNADAYKKVQQIDLLTKTKQYVTLDLSKGNTELYAIVCNLETAAMLVSASKGTKGKVKFEFKNQDGQALKDLMTQRIDYNPLTDDIEEYKEWHALLTYVQGFSDSNANGIPDLPDRYNPDNYQMLTGD